VDVFGAWAEGRAEGDIAVFSRNDRRGNRVPLRGAMANDDLSLAVYLHCAIVQDARFGRRSRMVRPARYAYELLGREDRELVVFHWRPLGRSRVTSPHAHISGARPIPLAQRPSGDLPAPLDLNNAHIPTGMIQIEEVLLMLIRDLGVQPIDRNWERIPTENPRVARPEGAR
jgi:hypothetical protein